MAEALDGQAGRIYPQFSDGLTREASLRSVSSAAAASTGSQLFWMHFGGGMGFTLALVDTLHSFGTTGTGGGVSGSQLFWSAFGGGVGEVPGMVHELNNFGATGGGGGTGAFWVFGDTIVS